jgi:protein-disulfide isomerase
MYINSSLAIVVVLIALIGVGVQAKRAKITGTIDTTNATAANGVTFGKAAAATVDIYEDFQCPNCLNFETAVHTTLESDARGNKAQLRYHTMAFLDAASNGNRYSSRAANAALCAADVSPDIFLKFHNILFTPAVQPKEGSSGRPDSDFVKYAQQAGMTAPQVTTFTTCVQTQQRKSLVEAITENASKRGVTGTPTVFVNGKKVSATLDALNSAIAAADAKGPKPSPSVTPSPTPTSSTSKSATPSASASATPQPTPSK